MSVDPWPIAENHPPMTNDEVHVWRVGLPMSEVGVAALRCVLSSDEIARADRFRLPKLRRNFTVARGGLRTLLGRYLNIEPRDVSLVYGALGKPSLDAAVHKTPLQFNLSHSGELAIYAFALGRTLGVDIECRQAVRNHEGLARRFFSPGEQAAIAALPENERAAAFFRHWVVKEAYLKAQGTGLSSPLDQFEVEFAPDAPPVIRDRSGLAVDWSCRELPCDLDYAAAVVFQGDGGRVQCWQWPGVR